MAIQQEEFKFPDEIPQAQDAEADDFKVEVVDDTPPEDRGRTPLPKEVVEELEKDDLQEYSDKVQQRLKQMKKVWHDERREKERAIREREEALRAAQHAFEESKRLKARLGDGEKLFVKEVTKAAETELGAAKEKLKAAYDSGDSDQIVAAQEALADAKLKLREYQNYRPSLQEEDPEVKESQQTQAQPVVDRKAESWRAKNEWFGADEEMTALALGLHEKLVKSGVDPRSDEYYERIDTTMRKRFPEHEWGDASETQDEEAPKKPAPRAKAANNVAPATRSTAPRQVRLTPSQIAIAKRLGLTPEAYAREMIKLESK
jgi:hypothetical protein